MHLPPFFYDDSQLLDDYKRLKAKLLLIPYSTTDDYIAFDNAEVAAQINKMKVLPNAITDVSQLTPE